MTCIKRLRDYFCFELFFVLFVFSFQYKNALAKWVPIDITLLLALLVLPLGIVLVIKNRRKHNNPLVSCVRCNLITPTIFVLFTVFCLIRSWGLTVTSYPLSKSLCFILYTAPAFLLSLYLVSSDKERINRFIFLTFVFSIIVGIFALRAFFGQSGAIQPLNNILGNNYLVTGQTLGIGSVICVFWILVWSQSKRDEENTCNMGNRYLLILLFSLMNFIQLNLGGRGPVLAAIGTIFIIFILETYFNKDILRFKDSIKILALILALSGAVYFLIMKIAGYNQEAALIGRINYGYIKSDQSILLRLEYYKSAFQCFLDNPVLGVGFGGWPYYHGLGQVHWHPHNIFLEVFAELGIVGGLLLVALFGSILYKIKTLNLKLAPQLRLLAYITLFCFCNTLKSGDLNDNLVFFAVLGILAGITRFNANNHQWLGRNKD